MDETAKKLPSSMESVMSNEDLLIQILVRLPLLSLILFKSVSKNWLCLIRDAINVTFRRNLDPPCGLFLQKNLYTDDGYDSGFYTYNFVPFDIRIPQHYITYETSLLYANFTFGPDVDRYVHIYCSCNGLLLCNAGFGKLYVYNPSITNMFKVLPKPDNVTSYDSRGVILAFDPTKSPHYKVIYLTLMDARWIQIHTYSSETGKWSVCEDQFSLSCFHCFQKGVYWNDAIYWLNIQRKLFRLDIMNENPVLTALPTPLTLDGKVRYSSSLYESRGCLLLFGKNNARSKDFTIYEKRNVCSEWLVKYIVNLNGIIKPFPKSWIIGDYVFGIVLGEKEEDSFLVLQLDKEVVEYKILSKTVNTISYMEENEDLRRCFQFIPSSANV